MNKHIGEVVEQCLKDIPQTRDSDFDLWLLVMEKLGNIKIEDSIPVELARKYPHATVVRHRAKLQNKFGMYPASDRIRCKRIHVEKKWYDWFLIK